MILILGKLLASCMMLARKKDMVNIQFDFHQTHEKENVCLFCVVCVMNVMVS